jgi:hypothetical protein
MRIGYLGIDTLDKCIRYRTGNIADSNFLQLTEFMRQKFDGLCIPLLTIKLMNQTFRKFILYKTQLVSKFAIGLS